MVGIISCVLDLLTLKQINKQYVNAVTALMGFLVDLIQLGMAGWLTWSIIMGASQAQ
jgi:hypothetical protein